MSDDPRQLEVGTELPAASWQPSAVQVFLYSAATRNPHRIHYDAEFANGEGQRGVVVQGPLQGSRLCSYLTRRFRGTGRISRLSLRNRRPVVVGDSVVLRGRVTAKHEHPFRALELKIWEENAAGEVVADGSALVELDNEEVGQT